MQWMETPVSVRTQALPSSDSQSGVTGQQCTGFPQYTGSITHSFIEKRKLRMFPSCNRFNQRIAYYLRLAQADKEILIISLPDWLVTLYAPEFYLCFVNQIQQN